MAWRRRGGKQGGSVTLLGGERGEGRGPACTAVCQRRPESGWHNHFTYLPSQLVEIRRNATLGSVRNCRPS